MSFRSTKRLLSAWCWLPRRLRPVLLSFGLLSSVGLAMPFAMAESPRQHLSLDAGWKIHRGDDWQAQPTFDIKKYLHAGDNVIAVGVYNGVAQGGLNPNVNVQIIGHVTTPPWARSLFNGLAQVIVQSSKDANEIKLSATADGLAPATAVMQTQPCTSRPSVP